MIILKIGEIDVSEYLNESYKIDRTSQNKMSFENYDGTTVTTSKLTTAVSAQLEDVPDGIAKSISEETKGTVTLTYTAPEMLTGEFECTSFSAELDNHGYDGQEITWYIDLKFSSLSDNSVSDGCL